MVRRMTRPARMPPAWSDVRPLRMMTMFLPSSSSTFWLPRAKPSPTADSTMNEITPQMIPNIVRALRSLFARRFASVWRDEVPDEQHGLAPTAGRPAAPPRARSAPGCACRC